MTEKAIASALDGASASLEVLATQGTGWSGVFFASSAASQQAGMEAFGRMYARR